MDIEIRPLSPQLAADYFEFFENRAFTDDSPYRCYCQTFQISEEQLNAIYKDTDPSEAGTVSRDLAEKQILSGALRGYLAYVDGVSIGWCNVNDRVGYAVGAYEGAHLHADAELREKAVACFEIAPTMRGKGVATALLKRAINDAAAEGYSAIVAFPVARTERFEWDHSGPVRLFEKEGFVNESESDGRLTMVKRLK